jgi:hypothetical protein
MRIKSKNILSIKKQCDNIIKVFSRIKKMQARVFDLFLPVLILKKKHGGTLFFNN